MPTDPSPPSPQIDALGIRLQAALGEAYAVEGQLGAGGFAVVYAVRDLTLKRKLAVKVLSPDIIASHSVLERFRREAETIAQLSHPHIVPLHFVGERDGLVYLAMAAIDGGTLAERLDREGPLSIEETVRILAEVASALAHAHKRGVIHRDIKPENVLLDAESGRALVTDFGIARTAEGGALTATGLVMGTAAYLAPEQLSGEPPDRRGDIYALGVMGYQMLAGRLPFEGATPVAILMKRMAGPPESLKALRSDVPDALNGLIASCLAIEAADRPNDAGDIARALRGASPVSGAPTSARTAGPKVSRAPTTRVVAMVGLLAAIVATTTLILTARGRTPVTPVRSSVPTPAVDSSMILIQGGAYTIGSATGPEASRPAHTVTLETFGIDAREVTVGQYEAFARATGAASPWGAVRPRSDIPVTGVTLAEAMRYCAWRHPDRGRLPREEEWEAAARGAEGRMYPWGDRWDPSAANTGSRRSGPVEVGSYPRGRSPLGVDDLIGNVWEWTSSPYRPYDAKDTAAGSGLYVIRGGAYKAYDEVSTAIYRGRVDPAAARSDLDATGFRCAMTARPRPI